MWQLLVGAILLTGLACMSTGASECKPKDLPTHVTITRMTDTLWEIDTDKGVYFEMIGENVEYIKDHTKLTLQNMGYNNLKIDVYF